MERTAIGPLRVSRIGLGAWAIGGLARGGTDEGEAVAAIRAALDLGVNLVDTAPVYGFGRSEEIVGRALEGRGDAVVATKAGLSWDDAGRVTRDSRPATLRRELEASLRRLRRDAVDLYQVHWPDPKTPIADTARELARMHEEGKIRAIGVSNFSPGRMDEWRAHAPLHSCQPPYNLLEREAERDVLPYCREHGIATLTYGALCRGLLSGRMDENTAFPAGDLRNDDPKFNSPRFERYLAAVAALDAYARERFGKRVLHLAVRWTLDHPAVTVALWGARRPDQVAPMAETMDFRLDEAARKEIADIVARHVEEPLGAEFMAPPQ